MWSQPLVDSRDEDGRLIADRELVVSRGHGAMPFETIDATFDRVPSLVVLGVELGRPTAASAESYLRSAFRCTCPDNGADNRGYHPRGNGAAWKAGRDPQRP